MSEPVALMIVAWAAWLGAWAPAGDTVPALTASRPVEDAEDDDAEEEDEEPVDLADLPPAARDTVLRLAGPRAIEEVEKHARSRGVVYEAEFRVDGVEQSVVVTRAGELVEVRKVVRPASLPGWVRAAVARQAPGGVIEEAEAVHPGGADAPARYEIEVQLGGRARLLTVPSPP